LENAAFKLKNNVFKSINQNMQVGTAVCNLAQAFDCVNHEILLAKLNYFQGTGKKLVQILSNR